MPCPFWLRGQAGWTFKIHKVKWSFSVGCKKLPKREQRNILVVTRQGHFCPQVIVLRNFHKTPQFFCMGLIYIFKKCLSITLFGVSASLQPREKRKREVASLLSVAPCRFSAVACWSCLEKKGRRKNQIWKNYISRKGKRKAGNCQLLRTERREGLPHLVLLLCLNAYKIIIPERIIGDLM